MWLTLFTSWRAAPSTLATTATLSHAGMHCESQSLHCCLDRPGQHSTTTSSSSSCCCCCCCVQIDITTLHLLLLCRSCGVEALILHQLAHAISTMQTDTDQQALLYDAATGPPAPAACPASTYTTLCCNAVAGIATTSLPYTRRPGGSLRPIASLWPVC